MSKTFRDTVRYMLRASDMQTALRIAELERNRQAVEVLKTAAAVIPSSENGELRAAAVSWLSSPKHESVTQFALAHGWRVPKEGRILLVGQATGAIVPEAMAKRTSGLDLTPDSMTEVKAVAIVAGSKEYFDDPDNSSEAMEDALRNAVILAEDTQTISLLSSGATSAASSDDLKTDVLNVLAALTRSTDAKLLWVLGATVHSAYMSRPVADRPAIFAESLVIRSDAIAVDSVLVVDLRQVAVCDLTGLRVSYASHASLELESDPEGDAMAGSPLTPNPVALTNLWQAGARGVKVERTIRIKRLRVTAARILTSVDWSGASA